MLTQKKSKITAVSLVALGVLLTSACGGGVFSFMGSTKTQNAPSQPNADSPLPPIATTGSYLTGILVDENGVALGNAWITLADGSRTQCDSEGRFKISFSNQPPSSIALSIEARTGKTSMTEVTIPDEVRTSINGSQLARVVRISVSSKGSITTSSMFTTAPVIKGFNATSALEDNTLSRV